eukprot:SM000030S11502  [mRNA]  locus=s30:901612:902555:- [translate_table: standard]
MQKKPTRSASRRVAPWGVHHADRLRVAAGGLNAGNKRFAQRGVVHVVGRDDRESEGQDAEKHIRAREGGHGDSRRGLRLAARVRAAEPAAQARAARRHGGRPPPRARRGHAELARLARAGLPAAPPGACCHAEGCNVPGSGGCAAEPTAEPTDCGTRLSELLMWVGARTKVMARPSERWGADGRTL